MNIFLQIINYEHELINLFIDEAEREEGDGE